MRDVGLKDGQVDVTSADKKYLEKYTEEQKRVQKIKVQTRLVDEYDSYIFPSRKYGIPMTSHIEEFINSYCGHAVGGMEELLLALYSKKGRPVQWADVGGGMGMAMRQLAGSPQVKERVRMTNVDLIKYDQNWLTEDEQQDLENQIPGISASGQAAAQFVHGNAETVDFGQKPDLITVIEVIQYLNNPLAAICNCYNQLADYGILVIAAEHTIPDRIRYIGTNISSDSHPMGAFLECLRGNNIPFDIGKGSFEPGMAIPYLEDRRVDGFNKLVIQKVPDTSLVLRSGVKKIWKNSYGFKSISYDPTPPAVEIGDGTACAFDMDYFEQMEPLI